MIIDKYLKFLNEDENIHPKSKEAISWFAATPASDIALGAGEGIVAYKAAKALGKPGGAVAKEISISAAKGAATSMALYAAYRYIRSIFDECTKKCGTLNINTSKRQLCMLECKKKSLEKRIDAARKHGDTKEKVDNTINDLGKVNQKIGAYRQYISKNKIT